VEYTLPAAAVGVGATLGMDLWDLFLKRACDVPSLDYCFLGRWLCHMPRGTLRHERIAAARPMRFECATGWCAHYTIGLLMAVAFVALTLGWLAQPRLLPALLYGIGTVAMPFLVLQP